MWRPTSEPTKTEIATPTPLATPDRDKTISEEKLEKIREEVRSIESAIEKHVAQHYPKSKVGSSFFRDPASAAIGRRGQAGFDRSWVTRDGSEIMIILTFGFDHNDAVTRFQRNIQRIAMGEFYAAPEFVGKDSILVENLEFNRKNTSVGLIFVKGRVDVSAYITNLKRKTAENEEELIEFVRSIEPLIVAKENIADL